MTTMIKIKCNGPGKCVNEIDLEKTLGDRVSAYKGAKISKESYESQQFPERVVLPCQYCTAGQVVITREMAEQAFRDRA